MLPPNSLPGESYCFARCFLEEQRRQQHISRSAAHPAAAGNARPGTLRAGLCECVHKCRRRQHHGCCVERKGRSWKHAHTHPQTQRVCKHFVKKRRRECERRASIDAELQIAFSLRSPFLHSISLSLTHTVLSSSFLFFLTDIRRVISGTRSPPLRRSIRCCCREKRRRKTGSGGRGVRRRRAK